MNSLKRSEAISASLQLVVISVLLVGPVASLWSAPGSPLWGALVLLPAAVVLVSTGCRHRRVPATLRVRRRSPSACVAALAVA